MKKVEGGVTTIYANKYYEKNLTSGVSTLYYYLGSKMAAYKRSTDSAPTLVHQDHLGSTADVTWGVSGWMRFKPYGETRASGGVLPDQKFTGQRLDSTGLYYYGARYYDPEIGRFISADSIVPDYKNPQALNRYSYVLNNPLKYTDPTGRLTIGIGVSFLVGLALTGTGTSMLVIDFDRGVHWGWLNTAGVAAEVGAGASIGLNIQITNARSISDLGGFSDQLGSTIATPVGGLGIESITGSGFSYSGFNFTPSWGVQVDILHLSKEYSWLAASGQPPTNPASPRMPASKSQPVPTGPPQPALPQSTTSALAGMQGYVSEYEAPLPGWGQPWVGYIYNVESDTYDPVY